MTDQQHIESYNRMREGCGFTFLESYVLKRSLERFSAKVCAGGLSPVAPDRHLKLASRTCHLITELDELIDLYLEQQDSFIIPVAESAVATGQGD